MSQFRLQADSMAFLTSSKAEDVSFRYTYLAFTVVQGPRSTTRSLCSHYLSFQLHTIICSKIEISSNLSLQLHLRMPCRVRSRVKCVTRRHKSEYNLMKYFIIIPQKWCIQLCFWNWSFFVLYFVELCAVSKSTTTQTVGEIWNFVW